MSSLVSYTFLTKSRPSSAQRIKRRVQSYDHADPRRLILPLPKTAKRRNHALYSIQIPASATPTLSPQLPPQRVSSHRPMPHTSHLPSPPRRKHQKTRSQRKQHPHTTTPVYDLKPALNNCFSTHHSSLFHLCPFPTPLKTPILHTTLDHTAHLLTNHIITFIPPTR